MNKMLFTTLPDVYFGSFIDAENSACEQLRDMGYGDHELTDDTIHQYIYAKMENLSEEWWDSVRRAKDPYYWLVVADLGLWYGHRACGNVFQSLLGALYACVDGMEDVTVAEDHYGNVMIHGYHHDGCNVYQLYRLSERGADWYLHRSGSCSAGSFAEYLNKPHYRRAARLSRLVL